MEEINEEQKNIRELQGELREKIEAIDLECEQLREETMMGMRQEIAATSMQFADVATNCAL
ncbi:hypothetical protein Gotur_034874 [Gossypium turneri]